ncbi:MAG: PAS domain S-box protein, partial [Methanobacterium sp.]
MELDNEWRYVDVNSEYEEIYGFKKYELVGKVIWEVLPQAVGSKQYKEFHKAKKENVPIHFEAKAVSGDWFEVHAYPHPEGLTVYAHNINERKKAEEALKENEANYRTFFNNPLMGFALCEIITDEEGEPVDFMYLQVNNAFESYTGLKKEKVLNKKVTEILPDDVADIIKIYGKVALTGESTQFEYPIPSLNKYFEIAAFSPSKMRFIAFFTDITERKKVEEELQRSEETARARAEELEILMDMVPASIFISEDPHCQSIVGNKEADRMYEVERGSDVSAGTTGGEVLNVERRFFKDGKELKPEELPMQAAVKKGKNVLNYEMDALLPSGQMITMFGNANPLFDDKGKVRGCLGVYVDITELKQAERALKEARDNLEEKVEERTAELELASVYNRSLIEASLDPLVTIGPDGKITDINKSTEMVTGFSRDELIGTDFSDYFTEPQKAKLGYQRVFREGEVRDYPLGIKHKKGHITPVLYNATVYKDEYDKVIGVFAAARDITEIQQAEKQLKEIINELERSNKELQSFAYITSHDLQEPLRSIASYAQLLKRRYEGQLDDDADDFIEFMVAGATRMKEQIQGLLEYSRVGTQGEEFKEFNSEETLNETLSILNSSLDECNAKITYDPLPNIYGDKSQITRVFQNLIGNALKFRREGVQPKIHISAQKKDDEYVFSVQDNGIGMEKQYSDRIFEVFKRLHPIGEYEGTGIGLAIVKRIIERHGGRIWVESELGEGSTFY